MKPPEGTPAANGTAWLLLKSLNDLKQSGLLWNREVNAFLLPFGFTMSKKDPCRYFRRFNDKLALLGLYVDNVIIVSEADADSNWVMRQLGVNTEHIDDGILLRQRDTIDEFLREMGMVESIWLVSLLVHVSVIDKALNACFVINEERQRFGLNYKYGQDVGSKVAVTIYNDADWAGDGINAKCDSGAVLMVNNSAMSWALNRQASVALSTMESEYAAAAVARKNAVWTKQLPVELRL
ncbi:Reverse transcriptase (RNA-dependent DNA polymerase) [Phytophthora infestans]|uniref:Reverse transcriptase (RNA-dependent DNA polymerase) n=1 Tax=Phytophthora infestans TaxID=4787 RepID=A0A8S9V975_PHYIN|nr:Reverse transcriptase (RNA-dependent DNA polymerase) [Phytophthora infestans]